MKELGCSDVNCWFKRNTGQVSNGGCHCVRAQATHTGDGWTIPVQQVQVMVAKAAQVAVEKERANDKHHLRPNKSAGGNKKGE